MAIRPARPDEAAALSRLALRSKATWGYDAAFMEACREELTLEPSSIMQRPTFLLEDQGEVRGFYQLVLEPQVADVALFFVAPRTIAEGVGRALWTHLEAEARRRAISRIIVVADPNAVGFYLKMGARAAGSRQSVSFPNRALPRLVKDLR